MATPVQQSGIYKVSSLRLGHRIGILDEPSPPNVKVVQRGKKSYRVQYLEIQGPARGQIKVQVTCNTCGEEVNLKVLSGLSQARRAFPFKILIWVIAVFILAILLILLTNNLPPTFFFILLLTGILFVPADLFVATASIVGHSEKHTLLKPKHGENKSKEKWLKEVVTNLQSDRYQEAVVACDQAIELDPNSAIAYGAKGAALSCLGRYEEALASCERALQLAPKLPAPYMVKGAALNGLGRYEEALASSERALQLVRNYKEALVSKGVALNGLKRHEEALVTFDQAIQLDRDYTDAYIGKVTALEGLGKPTEAAQAFQKARELGYAVES
jgi:tetratricopeptide (TPR) repeat protein